MAIEYSLICDDCGARICCSRVDVRAARAVAQLQLHAYCGGGVDRCASCRLARGKALLGDALKGAPSVGTRRPGAGAKPPQ